MKQFLAAFVLFYWENYIREDWSVLSHAGRIGLFVPWVLRSLVMWSLCPLILPEFLIKRSKKYQLLTSTPKRK